MPSIVRISGFIHNLNARIECSSITLAEIALAGVYFRLNSYLKMIPAEMSRGFDWELYTLEALDRGDRETYRRFCFGHLKEEIQFLKSSPSSLSGWLIGFT